VTYRVAAHSIAGVDGELVDAVSVEPNRPTLGLLVQADTEAQLRRRVRALTHAMRPKAGPGTLTVVTEEGEARSLTCYLEGGLEGDEADGSHLPGRWWKTALKFYAPSPWWEGEARTISFGLQAPVNFFPAPPFTLSPSAVQGSFTVDLTDCDAPAYPIWQINGPGSALYLTNETTGQSISLVAYLATSASTLVIDTRPGFQSVRLGTQNLLGSLSTDPALWPLVDGVVNRITATLTGATSGSRITASYRPRYAGV